MSVGAHRSLVTTPARKVANEGSALRADFCFRNSVCFQRGKGRTQNGRNTGEAHFKLGFVSLGVSCYGLFSPLVRERQQVLFPGNPADHGKEGDAARSSERLLPTG